MKIIKFQTSKFLYSCIEEKDFPKYKDSNGKDLFEIIIVGRSNVGKSSLINHLLNKKTAYVSSKPGKTQTLNFFLIDNSFLLVDMPGYGYAKRSSKLKNTWARNIDIYLNKENSNSFILFLFDSRRDLPKEDKDFLLWAKEKNIPIGIIFTKCDKLTKNELRNKINNLEKEVSQTLNCSLYFTIKYSIKFKEVRKELISKINEIINKD